MTSNNEQQAADIFAGIDPDDAPARLEALAAFYRDGGNVNDPGRELWSPDMAREALKNLHPRQRRLEMARVKDLARAILRGEWEYQAPGVIAINKEGQLMNGQHQLHALVLAGVPIYLMVIRNAPDTLMTKMDTGMVRTPRALAYMGLGLSTYQSAAITGAYRRMLTWRGRRMQKVDLQVFKAFDDAYGEELDILDDICLQRGTGKVSRFRGPQTTGVLLGALVSHASRRCRDNIQDFWANVMNPSKVSRVPKLANAYRSKILKIKTLSNSNVQEVTLCTAHALNQAAISHDVSRFVDSARFEDKYILEPLGLLDA